MAFCRACGKEIDGAAAYCSHCGAQQVAATYAPYGKTIALPSSVKWSPNQSIAIILAALFGAFGIHRFYMRSYVAGFIHLAFCWSGITAIFAVVEACFLSFMSPQEWADKYNNGVDGNPIHVLLKAASVIILMLVVGYIIVGLGIFIIAALS